MVIAIMFFLLLPALHTSLAQQRQSNISLGSSLTPTSTNSSSWLSGSGLYAFGFYKQANGYAVGIFLAGIPEKTVVWTALRDNPKRIVPSNATLLLSTDGRLLLQPTQGQDIYIVTLDQSASSASMLDSGNFVFYNSDQQIIWQSFEHSTDTLLPGQRLTPGLHLYSSASDIDHSKGIFILAMQTDGNLVQYPDDNQLTISMAYYASDTAGAGNNVSLNLDDDGRLYLLNSNSILRNLTGGYPKEGMTYLMRIDADGIFRVYSHSSDPRGNWTVLWQSSNDKCQPKGLCGINGFCVLMDEKADCKCLPGFDFVDPGKWSSGCERNFTAVSCKEKEANVVYVMWPLRNTWWENNQYSVSLLVPTEEDCEEACLEDCNCEGALYKDGECRKQSLPLRYGRTSSTESTVAFIKVGTSKPITNVVPIDKHKKTKKELRMDILIISILLVALAFVVFVISGVLIYRNRVWAYRKISEKRNIELGEEFAPRAFTYAELEQVTDGFKEELGSGSFGKVYKGTMSVLSSLKMVAVKRLEKVLAEGEREFQAEMKVIGKTHHRNLVQLLGYCLDGPKRLLVYEYMSNGSLADILFVPENRPSWDERIRLALDIARGILYLHEECETQIIHCDIKPQNILMDEYRCAKISDFGLAKLLKPDETRIFTGIRGTKGYVAPEWHRKLPATVKADVYSFGIVLFEIICCRRNVDWSLPEDEAVLEEWVYNCFNAGEMVKLVGDEQVDKRKLEKMVKVGLWCIQDEPSLRPSMKKVLLMLEGTVEIPIPPNPTFFLSAIQFF